MILIKRKQAASDPATILLRIGAGVIGLVAFPYSLSAQYLYIARSDRIQRCDLGAGPCANTLEDVLVGISPRAIEIDHAARYDDKRLYWAEQSGQVRRAKMDGSAVEDVPVGGGFRIVEPGCFRVDSKRRELWVLRDFDGRGVLIVRRVNLDTGSITDSSFDVFPCTRCGWNCYSELWGTSFALDVDRGKVFFLWNGPSGFWCSVDGHASCIEDQLVLDLDLANGSSNKITQTHWGPLDCDPPDFEASFDYDCATDRLCVGFPLFVNAWTEGTLQCFNSENGENELTLTIPDPWNSYIVDVRFAPLGRHVYFSSGKYGKHEATVLRVAFDGSAVQEVVSFVGDGLYTPALALSPAPIQIVDFDDPQFRSSDGLPVPDPARLSVGGRPVTGMAADGAACVLLRTPEITTRGSITFEAIDSDAPVGDNGRDGVGTLCDATDRTKCANPLTIQLRPGLNRGLAFLRSPLDFVRPALGEEDISRRVEQPRHLRVEATYTSPGGQEFRFHPETMDIHRPPVVLVHGIWGSAETWEWEALKDQFLVYRHDYSCTNDARHRTNMPYLRRAIETTLRVFRGVGHPEDKQLAATQVDLVGHSMGGLLGRLYVSGYGEDGVLDIGNYRRPDNLMEGDVHRLITLGSPHKGSPWAPVIMNLLDTFLLGPIVADIARDDVAPCQDFCLDCGAVEQLTPEWVSQLPGTNVPAFAIRGTGGSDLARAGLACDPSVFHDQVCTVIDWVSWFERWLGIDLLHCVFADEQHDMLVTLESAAGGLDDSHTLTVGATPTSLDGVHTYMTKSAYLREWVRLLLHEPVSDLAAGFAANAGYSPTPACSVDLRAIAGTGEIVQGGIAITAPAPNALVGSGDSLLVTVEGANGFQPVSVMVATATAAHVDGEAPFELTVEVPRTALGPATITAFAFDATGRLGVAEPVAVRVESHGILTGVSVSPDPIVLLAYAKGQQVSVTGHFDDGVDRRITSALLGTTYEVDNPSVATVGADGWVSANAIGKATLTARNAGYSAPVDVNVVSVRWDYDSSSHIDLPDGRAFTDCLNGPAGAAAVRPSVICRDFFDDDLDGDVDLLDWAGFQNNFAPARSSE